MARKKNTNLLMGEIGVDYARYSSHNQKEASIEQQVAACQQKAKELGITLIESYEDRAITGKTDKRPSFQRMMKDAEKGKFKYVIAWKSNRIGRNMLEAMMNEAKLQSWGVRVLYVEESFDDTAAGRFALRSMMNVNQFYSENMAEDIKRAMFDNANNCKVTNGNLPFGYKADENLKYIIDEPKDAIVREIYSRVACGEAFVDIASSLNAQGRHRVFGDYLLTGKLFCGHCNAPMTGYSGTSKSGTLHHYYVCQKKRTEHTCKKDNVRRDDIEIAVAKAIRDYALQPDIIEWIADMTVENNKKQEESSHIAILQNSLDEAKKGIKNIMTAIEQGIITETTKDRLLELEGEQAKLNAQISAAKADIISVPREDLISGLSLFRDGDFHNKQYIARLFDTFLVAVYLYDNEFKIVFGFNGKNILRVPFDVDTFTKEEKDIFANCSYKLATGSP